jgi:hypothetical protein
MDDDDLWWDEEDDGLPPELGEPEDQADRYELEGPWDAGYTYGTLEDDYSEGSSP